MMNQERQTIVQAELDNRVLKVGEVLKFPPELEIDIINATLDAEFQDSELDSGGLYRLDEIYLTTLDLETKSYQYEFTFCVVHPPHCTKESGIELKRDDLLWYTELVRPQGNS